VRNLLSVTSRLTACKCDVIDDKGSRDVDDVAREVDKHGEQSSQLNYGDARSGLFRLETFVDSRVKADSASSEDEMGGGTNRDEFCKTLDDAEDDSLENGHIKRWWLLVFVVNYRTGAKRPI
jgi:hypothetical protein